MAPRGNLDGDGDASGIIGEFAQPLCEFRNRMTGVREGALGHNSPFVVPARTPSCL
jgi:hypothetical protein